MVEEEKKEETSFWDSVFGSDDEDTVSTEGQASTESLTDSENKTETTEVPITNYEEALAFGMKELGKQRRQTGHQVELKVIGHMDFRVGEWCHVYLPTYNEDSFMFISKVSNECGADSEFITSLTLVDYPPSLGQGKANTASSDASGESTGEEGETSGEDGEESGGSGSGSGSSSTHKKGSATAIRNVVNKYYGCHYVKPKITEVENRFINAKTGWTNIAKIVNTLDTPCKGATQDQVIREILKYKGT